MLSKNKRPYDAGALPPSQRLRSNLTDLYATNSLSSERIHELCSDINGVAPAQLGDVLRNSGGLKNRARKLRRVFMKHNQWPNLYEAKVRCWNPKSACEEPMWLSFLLPHELVNCLCKHGNINTIMGIDAMDPNSLAHLRKCEAAAGCKLLGLGLWGDGMPCNWDRSESIDTLSLNLPGHGDQYKNLRMPLTAIPHKHIGPHTWHDICEVVAWSLTCLASGSMPPQRHDNTPWRLSDKAGTWYSKPRSKGSVSIAQRAALVEIRADWKFYSEVFHFPYHNEVLGMCWKCRCTPDQVTGLHACMQ